MDGIEPYEWYFSFLLLSCWMRNDSTWYKLSSFLKAFQKANTWPNFCHRSRFTNLIINNCFVHSYFFFLLVIIYEFYFCNRIFRINFASASVVVAFDITTQFLFWNFHLNYTHKYEVLQCSINCLFRDVNHKNIFDHRRKEWKYNKQTKNMWK